MVAKNLLMKMQDAKKQDAKESLCKKELVYLREEINSLKNCQVTFVTVTVTGTGLLLGLTVNVSHNSLLSKVYLFPLIFLLPAWWIFFMKAKTITRIVGYYRILEKLFLGDQTLSGGYIGWENSQAEYRKYERSGKLKKWTPKPEGKLLRRVCNQCFLRSSPYWMLIYYIFFILATVCWYMSFYVQRHLDWSLVFAGLFIVVSAASNFYIVGQLIWGRDSYDSNECYWIKILSGNGTPCGHEKSD
jgi:hypothetical protein